MHSKRRRGRGGGGGTQQSFILRDSALIVQLITLLYNNNNAFICMTIQTHTALQKLCLGIKITTQDNSCGSCYVLSYNFA